LARHGVPTTATPGGWRAIEATSEARISPKIAAKATSDEGETDQIEPNRSEADQGTLCDEVTTPSETQVFNGILEHAR
jgi:hypothetical protein